MSLSAAYARYYGTGLYDRRYPRVNGATWRRVLRHIQPSFHVLDYGCGNGRYLLALRGRIDKAAGFDISQDALDQLRNRAENWESLHLLGPNPSSVSAYIEQEGPVDMALCLFGVLSHIDDPEQRQRALATMAKALKPETGRLILSVPNQNRRFYAEQRAAGPKAEGRISYTRSLANGGEITLAYQLFTPQTLHQELTAAGFRPGPVWAESLLPESWLTRWPILGRVDGLICRILPAQWGYGLYVEATLG